MKDDATLVLRRVEVEPLPTEQGAAERRNPYRATPEELVRAPLPDVQIEGENRIMKLMGISILLFVITVVACGNDNPVNNNTKGRIVTYEEFLMLIKLADQSGSNLGDAWEIAGDEGKLKTKWESYGLRFTWIWLNSDGSYVECDFGGPLCFDREGEITDNGQPYDVDYCFRNYQFMRVCRQSGL